MQNQTAAFPDSVTQTATRPQVVRAGEGGVIDLGDHRARAILGAAQTGGVLLLADVDVDANGGPPLHVHTREDEVFHILAGRFEFQIGEKRLIAEPGDTIYGPRDVPQAWRCLSDTGGRILGLITPAANFEGFAAAMMEQGIRTEVALVDSSVAAAQVAVAARFGIHIPGVA